VLADEVHRLRHLYEMAVHGRAEMRAALRQLSDALRAALAEQPAQPVAWEWRWFDTSPYTVTSGQWSEWKRVEPRNSLCTLDDALNEFRAYIANGLRYELRAIYTAPQPRKRLTDQEIDAVWDTVPQTQFWWRRYARAIEAAVWGEKT